MEKSVIFSANVDIDEALEKANRLVELLREASSLASSLGGRSLIDPMEKRDEGKGVRTMHELK